MSESEKAQMGNQGTSITVRQMLEKASRELPDDHPMRGLAKQAGRIAGDSIVATANQARLKVATDLHDTLTQAQTSLIHVAEQIQKSPYKQMLEHLSAATAIEPAYRLQPSYPNVPSDLEVRKEPRPMGGKQVAELKVRGGDCKQIGEVLSNEFCAALFPLCYIWPHPDEENYWYIQAFQGSETEALELLNRINPMTRLDNSDAYDALDEWEKITAKIGYVCVSERPLKPVWFYVFEEESSDQVLRLADAAAYELLKWEFEVEGWERSEGKDSLPEGAETFENFKAILIRATVDTLEDWTKGYLRANGHIAESTMVQQKPQPDGQVYIRYTFADCLIEIRTKTIRPMEIQVKPVMLCWQQNPKKRTVALNAAAKHLQEITQEWKQDLSWKPIKPQTNESLDEWFDYLHECEEAKIPYSLKVLAADVHRDYGYIRQLHARYLAERRY